MKNRVLLLFGCALACLLSGCFVHSLNPLFAEKDLVSYSDLVGSWQQDKSVWTFARDGKSYKLTHVDEKTNSAIFRVGVGKLGTDIFMDMVVEDLGGDDRLNQLAAVHLIPAHVMLKVGKLEGKLVLTALDPEWMRKQLKDSPGLLPHVFQEDRPVLTASTEELQQFARKYAGDTNAFKNQIVLEPKK